MNYFLKHRWWVFMICVTALLAGGMIDQANAHNVTLSMYEQGFNVGEFYDNGEFSVDDGIMNSDPKWLLVVIGDLANVEDIFETTGESNPFDLELAGADFHFEVFQPFRFPDRFDGLFSTTVDDPMLLVLDNLAIADVRFYDDGVLADDRIDLSAYSAELPEFYFEVDSRDKLYLTMLDGTVLRLSDFTRNDDLTGSFNAEVVPEPGTIVMVGLGLAGIFGLTRRRKMKLKKNILLSNLSILFLLLTISVIILLPSIKIYAYNIGPDFCSFDSPHANQNPVCNLFQDTYENAIEPATPAGATQKVCFDPVGHITSFADYGCPPGYFEGWAQLFTDQMAQGAYIACNVEKCLVNYCGDSCPIELKPPTPPKLIDVNPPVCVDSGQYLPDIADKFGLIFQPYEPLNYQIIFSPSVASYNGAYTLSVGDYEGSSYSVPLDVVKPEPKTMTIPLLATDQESALEQHIVDETLGALVEKIFKKVLGKSLPFGFGIMLPNFAGKQELSVTVSNQCCPNDYPLHKLWKVQIQGSADEDSEDGRLIGVSWDPTGLLEVTQDTLDGLSEQWQTFDYPNGFIEDLKVPIWAELWLGIKTGQLNWENGCVSDMVCTPDIDGSLNFEGFLDTKKLKKILKRYDEIRSQLDLANTVPQLTYVSQIPLDLKIKELNASLGGTFLGNCYNLIEEKFCLKGHSSSIKGHLKYDVRITTRSFGSIKLPGSGKKHKFSFRVPGFDLCN